MKVTRPHTLTRKVNNAPTSSCSTTTHGACSTCTQKRQAAAAAAICQPHASGQGTVTCDNEEIEGGGDDEDEQGDIRPRSRARKFHNVDLPGLPGSLSTWWDAFLPRWFLYIATNDNIWQLDHPDHLAVAQKIWNRKMPIHQMLALRDEPVFSLVNFLLL